MKICFVFEDLMHASHLLNIKVKVIDQLLLCILLFCSILKLLLLYVVLNLGLAAEVMYILVSPGFWMIFPMILVQGLPMTLTVAYINPPAM